MIVFARWVVPIDAPLVENGAVRVEGGRIVAVGPRAGAGRPDGLAAWPGEPVVDLGSAALLPGLVDAHAHLEWSALRGLLDGRPLEGWPDLFPKLREAFRLPDDYLASARLGALEALEGGITTLADSGPTGSGLVAMLEMGLGGRVAYELLGPDPEAWEGIADGTEREIARLEATARGAGGRIALGLAPHGLHTVSTPLLRWCRRLADAKGLPLSLHLAESAAEVAFLTCGSGPWADLYARRGVEAIAPGERPVPFARRVGFLTRGTILAHCVHVTDEEIGVIAASGAGVACCPQSNAALGVGAPPLAGLLGSGVPFGLGTDSGASVGAKDLFAEARTGLYLARLAAHDAGAPGDGARRLLEAATLGGARALGIDAEVGSLAPGKRADLVAVALDGPHLRPLAAIEAVLVAGASRRDVVWVMTDGEVRVEGGVARVTGREAILAEADRVGARASAVLAPEARGAADLGSP